MKYKYTLKNLDCANCARKIEEEFKKYDEFKNVRVNFSTLKLSYESNNASLNKVSNIIKSVEPDVCIEDINNFSNENYFNIIRFLTGIILAISGILIKNQVGELLIILSYLLLLYRTFKTALKLIFKKTINENLLITISCIGAYLINEKIEGLMVIILYEIGKMLEDRALNNSRKSIGRLMDLKSDYVNLENGSIIKPEQAKIDDIIIVKTGEKIPLDGIIIEGNTYINNKSLTGESKPIECSVGDKVLSGSINDGNIIKVKVLSIYQDSTVNKILELVENATDNKAKTETFVNKLSKIYTPIVLILSLLVLVFLPLLTNINYQQSIYRALVFLAISCPCAIVISVPLSYFSAIGAASKKGILIKGSNYLDNLYDIKEIIFDKTGTLTKGEFDIDKIEVFDNKYSKKDILKYVYLGERYSTHPIAKSILKYDLENINITDFKEIKGMGISYKLKSDNVKIGSMKFVNYDNYNSDFTSIFVSINNNVIGVITLSDQIKDSSKKIIETLNNRNIGVKMFTGDNKKSAFYIAKKLNIKEFYYEMLPKDKYNKLKEVKDSCKGKVAFVGDGVNDALVLVLADVGISMGGVGTSSAVEASDMVIMEDNLLHIIDAIDISKYTKKIIKENLVFALSIKVLILLLSVLGYATLIYAVFADVGVTLITIFNTLRIIKRR